VGIRERLETIRANNESSYDDPEFQPVPAGKGKGGGTGKAGAAPWPAVSPWLTVWTRPGGTIRAVVASDPGRWVLVITLLVGLGKALNRASARHLCDHWPLSLVLGGCAALGPVVALVMLYLSAAALWFAATVLGGRTSARAVRAAIAWGSVPQVVVLLLWVPALLAFGDELFSAAKPLIMGNPGPRLALVALYIADAVLLIWSLVLTIRCLADVLGLGLVRFLAALAMMTAAVFVTVLAVMLLAVAAATVVRSGGRTASTVVTVAPRAPAPAVRPAPRRAERERFAKKPAADLGETVAAIWEEGYGIEAKVDPKRPGRPVVELKLSSDLRRLDDRTLRHLDDLPELRKLDVWGGAFTGDGLRHLRGLSRLQSLMFFASDGITDEGLESLSGLTGLQTLGLWKLGHVTDDGLRHLRGLTQLQSLTLSESGGVTDEGLECLSGMTELRSLTLWECPGITGAGLAHLQGATDLDSLALYDCGPTDDGLNHLPGLSRLANLTINGAPKLSDEGLAFLPGMTGLRSLTLYRCRGVTGVGLADLKGVPSLRKLDLFECGLTDDGLAAIATLTTVRDLTLSDSGLNDERLALLEGLRDLASLEISGRRNEITGAGLSHLAGLAKLRTLRLREVRLSDEAVEPLSRMTGLGTLELSGSRISVGGLTRLRKALRKVKISAY
jgi:hypothetical protein